MSVAAGGSEAAGARGILGPSTAGRSGEDRGDMPRVRTAPLLAAVLLLLLGGCAGGGGPLSGADGPAGRVQQCKSGDTPVASEADCLQDDAACYALADGGYCTGERGNVCPAGSSAVPDGAACPPGARCFRIGESLSCVVSVG